MKKKRPHKELLHKPLLHKPFWITLGGLFLLSLLTFLYTAGEGTLTGNLAVQNIAGVKAGTTMQLEVHVGGIELATLHFDNWVQKSQVQFTEDTTLPFEGTAYSKVKMIYPKEAGRIDLILKIDAQDLFKKKLNPKEVQVYLDRREAVTTLQKEEGDYFFYASSLDTRNAKGEIVVGKATSHPSEERVTTILPSPSQEGSETRGEKVLPSEEIPTVPSSEALTGKAEEQQEMQQPGLWEKAKAFFKNLLKE